MHWVGPEKGTVLPQPWHTPCDLARPWAAGSTCPGCKAACTTTVLSKPWHRAWLLAPQGQRLVKLHVGQRPRWPLALLVCTPAPMAVVVALVALLLLALLCGCGQHCLHHQYLHKSFGLLRRGALHCTPSSPSSCFLHPWHTKLCLCRFWAQDIFFWRLQTCFWHNNGAGCPCKW